MYFVWLGSKRAKKQGVGNKGQLLDMAMAAGLPVPAGGIILDSFYQLSLEHGLALLAKQQVTIPDPQAMADLLYEQTHFPKLARPVAIRSAFSAEDRADQSLAGFFTSQLFVRAGEPRQLAEALSRVWSSALRREGNFRRDVLLMEMVEAEVAGVAFSEQAYQDDLVNFSQGLADSLVSGRVEGQTMTLPQLQGWEAATAHLPPFAQRLQKLLRGLRRTFGRADWDVEWADDGQICWLVQLRPVTRPTRRNEAFTFANLREVLPDLPSPFMTSVVAEGSAGLYDFYRRYDSHLPSGRNMVEIFKGRPLFNLSLLSETMRVWGLPTALVTNSLGGQSEVEVGLKWGRFFSHTLPLLRLGLAQLGAVGRTGRVTRQLLPKSQRPGHTFSQCADNFRDLFTLFVNEMLNLTAALSGPLLLLRLSGSLAEHSARQRTITSTIFSDLQPLREMVSQNPAWQSALAQGELPDDLAFKQLWQAYLARHGHRGIYESDIARPRYQEQPAMLLQSLLQPAGTFMAPPPRTWQGLLTWPIWWQCSRVMRSREQWRADTMAHYQIIRRRLLELAGRAVAADQLPTPDSLWLLTLPEVRQLDSGLVYLPTFFAQRQQELAEFRRYNLPDLLHRFDDFEQFTGDVPAGANLSQLRGLSLTGGIVSGRAWVLSEPSVQLPPQFTPNQTILVARSVDPGWIATFALTAGVVVEIGGDLSHGSILLREIGRPAITNVRQATRYIQTGEQLILNATEGTVNRRPSGRN